MKHYTLILIAAALLAACNRTTVVSGRITNVHTGNPVAGMLVTLNAYNGHDPQDSANPKKVGESSTYTDADGAYSLEYSGQGIDDVSLWLDGGWFCTSFFDSEWSDYPEANAGREVNIQIDSIDGRIQLVLRNQNGLSEKLYVRVDCDATGEKGIACCNYSFENTVAPGAVDTISFPISAGRSVPVYWGTATFSGWNAPHIDSVYCPRGQTTAHLIDF